MSSSKKFTFVWVICIIISAAVGWLLEDVSFLGSLLCAMIASVSTLIIVARSSNEARYRDLEREVEEEEDANGGVIGLREEVIAQASNVNVDKIWQAEISRLCQSETFEMDLLSEYKRLALRLYDEVDPYYSEEVAGYKISMILRMLGKTPYSFRRFCKALGH